MSRQGWPNRPSRSLLWYVQRELLAYSLLSGKRTQNGPAPPSTFVGFALFASALGAGVLAE